MNAPTLSHLHKQHGAALIVSLVLLTALTLIGLSSLQVTALEEKMAGVEQDYNLGFQSAEAALREGEAYIDRLVSTAIFGTTTGLLGEAQDDGGAYYLTDANWSGSNASLGAINVTNPPPFIPTEHTPQFIIKYVEKAELDPNARLNVGGYGESTAGGLITFMRVTARSVGKGGNSKVVLQTYYGKRF